MRLVKCKTCGAEIARSANRCPNCGAQQHTGAYIACFVIIIITIIAIAIILSGSEPDPDPQNTAFVEQSKTIDDFGVSVTNFYFTDEISSGALTAFTPSEGNQFAVVEVTVTNNGTEANTFLPYLALSNDTNAVLTFGEYKYSRTVLIGYEKDVTESLIQPLASFNGIIAFEVPQAVYESTDPLVLTIQSYNETIDFDVR